jgi:hypothetical protein
MTLPEVLITVVISGLLVTGMASATMVVLSQHDNSEGRLNNARSEQTVGTWLPSDLASAEDIDNRAQATPCGTAPQPACPSNITLSGSNALMLTWTGSIAGVNGAGLPIAIPTMTTVSYRYMQMPTGEWEVHRVACVSVNGAMPSCEETVVLHQVDGPPIGVEFFPGVTEPIWVMKVQYLKQDASVVNDALAVEPLDPTYKRIPGRRVTVTINGGGDVAAGGGGVDQITLSAGGTVRTPNLSTSNLSSTPTFAATRSRCGGNFGLQVDTSGSIGSNMSYVRSGITAFINAFAGTPVKLQVVAFSSTATTLGAAPGWSKYYDMLVDTDVTALKALVTGLNSNGFTNWEDAMFRMFKNSDGTVQQVLPSTLILFTDGMPTYNRLNATSASAPVVRDPDDTGLPDATSSGSYNQLSWNRANRLLREYDVDLERIVGVFVGTDITGTSSWRQQGAGYHLTNFLHGYHNVYDQGFNVTGPVRGYHNDYQYAASGVTYQYATNGMQYQYASTGMLWQTRQNSSKPWTNTTWATYLANNTKPDGTDNYQAIPNGTPGGWTTFSGNTAAGKTAYDKSNSVLGDSDGFRVTASSPSGWANIGTNATAKALYDLSNSVAGPSDGYQVAVTGTLGTWTTTTQAYYLLNDTNSTVETDGFRANPNYTSPYSSWAASDPVTFITNNTTSDATDGWDATSVTNIAPFNAWKTATQAEYTAGLLTPTAASWRATKTYSTPYSLWDPVTEAEYSAVGANSVWGATDGWDATKVYSEPFTFHENSTTYSRTNTAILQQLIAPAGVVPAIPAGGPYTNASEATYYELPAWTQFSGAMTSMALAECGGTVTLQTKVGGTAAPDPFTYFNSVDKSTATTSSQFRSGTFDYDLAGGVSVDATISLLNADNLTRYHPVSWSCKSGGADYPFTLTPGAGGWSDLHVHVVPNQAISCVQLVSAA